MARRKLKPSANPDGDGRPVIQFTQEQIDSASEFIGQCQYTSRAVDKIREKYSDFSRETCYELCRVARARVFSEMRSRGEDDPLTAVYLYLKGVIANPHADERNKLTAANQIARLFGLERLAQAFEGAGGVEEFLAGVYTRRLASGSLSRLGTGEPKADPQDAAT